MENYCRCCDKWKKLWPVCMIRTYWFCMDCWVMIYLNGPDPR